MDALEDVGTRSFKYLYDFGDGWEHAVRIERITDPTGNRLSSVGRRRRTLPAGGRRRSLGLQRVSRSDRRSRPRRPRPYGDVGWRPIRSQGRRRRRSHARRRRSRQALVTDLDLAAEASLVNRGLPVWIRLRRTSSFACWRCRCSAPLKSAASFLGADRPALGGLKAVRYRCESRTIVQRTKISAELSATLKSLGISAPKQDPR